MPRPTTARTLELCRLAKEARLTVTQGRVIGVFRSLQHTEWTNEDEVRLALRINLASSREEELVFDRLFHTYWHSTYENEGARVALNRGMLREGSARSTVAIIISDGYDTSDPTVIAQEMRALRRRVQKVAWINPMYGS